MLLQNYGSSRLCVISLTYIGLIDLCVFVVRSTPSLGGMYLRVHFTHQIQESQIMTPKIAKVNRVGRKSFSWGQASTARLRQKLTSRSEPPNRPSQLPNFQGKST
ncbi:hypothetical protein EZJ55_03220 [Microcystis aeruginosa EAWAG127a]|uniref:Uncharacterized protein n=1 Tax=Microcystis aeruginosa EAWAG127a TaxID=2529855 RepID=A0A5J5LQC3_MICAE|nr:hypothetical protein EZJ55_03220 [Microcystis aeruginosa EAWAG127a]